MPAPPRKTKSPLLVRAYAIPTRGARFPYVVAHREMPMGASASAAGLFTLVQDASVVAPRAAGAGSSSQRKPYVTVSRAPIFHVSWAYKESAWARNCDRRSVDVDRFTCPVVTNDCTFVAI